MPLICAHGAAPFVFQSQNDWGPRSTHKDPPCVYWATEQLLFGCGTMLPSLSNKTAIGIWSCKWPSIHRLSLPMYQGKVMSANDARLPKLDSPAYICKRSEQYPGNTCASCGGCIVVFFTIKDHPIEMPLSICASRYLVFWLHCNILFPQAVHSGTGLLLTNYVGVTRSRGDGPTP